MYLKPRTRGTADKHGTGGANAGGETPGSQAAVVHSPILRGRGCRCYMRTDVFIGYPNSIGCVCYYCGEMATRLRLYSTRAGEPRGSRSTCADCDTSRVRRIRFTLLAWGTVVMSVALRALTKLGY